MMECLVDCRNTLGEGCIWDPRDECVYWTDIEECRIFRWDGKTDPTVFSLPERAAFLLPRARDGFVVGFSDRIVVTSGDFSSFKTIATVEEDLPQTRVNDAVVDPEGGIVFGTFDERDRLPAASVYRLSPEGVLERLFGDVTISNGLAFSPDGAIMYFADTVIGTIHRFAVQPGKFSLSEIAPLASAAIAPGQPDGAVVDAEGNYWSARVWGSCVACISPDGELIEQITLPVKGPTCLVLGGTGLRGLFVTTLRTRHTPAEIAAAPQAGGLFAVEVSIVGCNPRLCAI